MQISNKGIELVAKKIASELQITKNVPYTYGEDSYLEAEDVIERIIRAQCDAEEPKKPSICPICGRLYTVIFCPYCANLKV